MKNSLQKFDNYKHEIKAYHELGKNLTDILNNIGFKPHARNINELSKYMELQGIRERRNRENKLKEKYDTQYIIENFANTTFQEFCEYFKISNDNEQRQLRNYIHKIGTEHGLKRTSETISRANRKKSKLSEKTKKRIKEYIISNNFDFPRIVKDLNLKNICAYNYANSVYRKKINKEKIKQIESDGKIKNNIVDFVDFIKEEFPDLYLFDIVDCLSVLIAREQVKKEDNKYIIYHKDKYIVLSSKKYHSFLRNML